MADNPAPIPGCHAPEGITHSCSYPDRGVMGDKVLQAKFASKGRSDYPMIPQGFQWGFHNKLLS